jgi:hypothetical protein
MHKIKTLNIITFSLMTFGITLLSRASVRITTFSKAILSIMAFCKTTLSITTVACMNAVTKPFVLLANFIIFFYISRLF